MATLTRVLRHLRSAQQRLKSELQRVETALNALSGLGGRGPGRPPGGKGRRRGKMSAAGRARIAAAQRARWAKIRAQKRATRK